MSSKATRIAFVMMLGSLLAAGCGTARRTEPIAPALALSDPTVLRGQVVFFAHCHQCHPQGGTGLGPAITNKPLPGFVTKIQVRHGLGAMPAFAESTLSPDDLNAVVRYLRVIRANQPARERTDPNIRPEPEV